MMNFKFKKYDKEEFKEYNRKFRKQSTTTLKKDYKSYNSDFKRIARAELIKRGAIKPKKSTSLKSGEMWPFW